MIRWPWLLLTVVVLIGLLVVCVVSGENRLEAIRQQEDASIRRVAQAQQELEKLQDELEMMNMPEYIKTLAREYDYIMPGELRFEITNPELLSNYTEEELQVYMDEKKK